MIIQIIYWFTRILAILSILVMIMFSFDAFGGEDPFGRQLLGFLIHNIPAFVLIISLIIAWKHEVLGGVIFILLFFALGVFFKSFSGNYGSLIIITPFLLAGAMFILHGVLSAKSKH